jgi:excisionase family DNA binding protein
LTLALRGSTSNSAVLICPPSLRIVVTTMNTAELDPAELDPLQKPFWKPAELHRLGMGRHNTVLDAIDRGDIPAVKVGRKVLIPTSWIRRQLGLDDS